MQHTTDHLPFWQFFYELEKQLSYERWIDKYKLFLTQLCSPGYLLQDTESPAKLLQLCKMMYLQDIRDEKRFEELFMGAWQREKNDLESFFQALRAQKKADNKETKKPVAPKQEEKNKAGDNSKPAEAPERVPTQTQQPTAQQADSSIKEYYYTPPVIPPPVSMPAPDNANTGGSAPAFNLLDEYFPVTRREMNKAWQYLRHRETGLPTQAVDIPATVKKLAKDNLFTEPVFIAGKKNRKDTLLLFVDCNGSMVPFHELCRRLVNSAKLFGGHLEANVFYFQNYPSGYVFGRSNFTKPHKTVEAFAKANKQFTTAVIISDAGFARGYGNEERYKVRVERLEPFFRLLSDRCARTLWLNPLPANRWHKPTAAVIQSKVLKMAPVLEKGMNSFQSILRNLTKANSSLNV